MRIATGAAVLAASLTAACANPDYAFGPVETIDSKQGGYYPRHHLNVSGDTLMVLTVSGGGKRASAFAQGVLEALQAVPTTDGGTLLDEVDMISSVSGGSLTAANLVVNGPDSFDEYRERFLYRKLMGRLVRDAVLKPPLPWSLLVENNRIEQMVRLVEDTVVAKGTTFADIPRDRPYWILNATDIGALQTFPFTQYQFDTICADLDGYPVARAVSASAGFPLALSSVVIENSAPCPAQFKSKTRMVQDLDYITRLSIENGLRFGADSYIIERYETAVAKTEKCDAGPGCPRPNFIHLYDGGIADNLGLSEPLWLLTGAVTGWNPISRWVRNEQLRRVVILTANAGSAPDHRIGVDTQTPNMLTTLRRIISATIDRRSIGLTAQAHLRPGQIVGSNQDYEPETVIDDVLSFPLIEDAACQRRFSNLPTDWGLERNEIDGLLAVAGAMTYASEAVRTLAGVEQGSAMEPAWDEAQVCLLRQGCACLEDPASCVPPEAGDCRPPPGAALALNR